MKAVWFTILVTLALISVVAPVAGQSRNRARIILADGTAFVVDDTWEQGEKVCYRLANISDCKERAQVRRVELLQIDNKSTSSDATKTDRNGETETIWIHLLGGARIKVDEVSETSEGVWYRRGQLSLFLDRSRVARIERNVVTFPVVPTLEIAVKDLSTNSNRTLGSRTGQNAFGVKIKYKIVSYTALKLVMPRRRVKPWEFRLLIPSISPQQARQMMGGLKVALIGSLMQPFVDASSDYDRATLTEPEESHFQNYYLFFDPHALVVFDRRTGKLLGSLNLIQFQRNQHSGEAVVDVPKPSMKNDGNRTKPNPSQSAGSVGVRDAILLSKPEPKFPEEARAHTFSGVVRLRVVLGSTGQVTDITVIRGMPYGLTKSAIEAARQIKFIPAQRDGVNISKTLIVEYDFNVL